MNYASALFLTGTTDFNGEELSIHLYVKRNDVGQYQNLNYEMKFKIMKLKIMLQYFMLHSANSKTAGL